MSIEKITVLEIKGEDFQVPIKKEMMLNIGLEHIERSFLYVLEAGVKLLGWDLIVRFSLGKR